MRLQKTINHLISDITRCLLQATKRTHLMVRIPTHANQQTLWSTPIIKSSICTFLILLHGYTVYYSRESPSPMLKFFSQFLWRKPWTCCDSIQNCQGLLHFGLNIKIWSTIAHAHKFFPHYSYIPFDSSPNFLSDALFNSFLIFLDLLRFVIQLFICSTQCRYTL